MGMLLFEPTPLSVAIRSLFASGEQGAWYDPSDFSTLFQDAAGTTPVTALGQPVGLVLDKRLGLVLGSDLVDTANTAAGWTPQGNNTVVQDGDAVKVTYVDNAAGATIVLSAAGGLASNLVNGKWYEVRFQVKVSTGAVIASIVNTGAGTVGTPSVTNTSYVEYALMFFKGVLFTSMQFGLMSAGESVWIRNISVREIAGNHAYQTTAASRPTLQQDSNGLYYLSFDGTDDGMLTPSINFTGTDKMTVWAGVRKLSDAAFGIICELTTDATNLNGFYVAGYAATYRIAVGTPNAQILSSATFAAPVSNVLAVSYDKAQSTAATVMALRTNGTLNAYDVGVEGNPSGNFGNAPLFIGRRSSTSLHFNGRIYQLIVRGAASNAGQIAAGEAYVNTKTRAY